MDWTLSRELSEKYPGPVCGLDEAGRGPLAGPVYAAAVILNDGEVIPGLDDSKKLSPKKRAELEKIIKEKTLFWAVASVDAEEIDRINILNASMLAMKKAEEALGTVPGLLLIDGNVARGFDVPAIPVIKGDALIPSIAAASILAKEARDRFCLKMDEEYPQYCFKKHKGYPTKEHRDAVIKFGPCPYHRLSFLKKLT
ncbi:MAG: ribonuclease HII [Clostridia bacterium]|nr:ribonuclease HII [Clostridia bacterium]